MAIIAKIKLANGQVGYYDDYSKIYLTPSRPEAFITSGTNLYQIKKSIKSGRLKLVEGSLTEPPARYEVTVQETVANETPVVTTKKVEEAAKNVEEAEKSTPAETSVSENTEKDKKTAVASKPKRTRRKKNDEPVAEVIDASAELSEVAEEQNV